MPLKCGMIKATQGQEEFTMTKEQLEKIVKNHLYVSAKCFLVKDWDLMYVSAMWAFETYYILDTHFKRVKSYKEYFNEATAELFVNFEEWQNKDEQLGKKVREALK